MKKALIEAEGNRKGCRRIRVYGLMREIINAEYEF